MPPMVFKLPFSKTHEGGNGTISQVFTVPAAGTYSISFYSALRAYRTSPTLMSFNVTMDGTNIGSLVED